MANTTTALIVMNAENVNTLVNKELRQNVSKMLKATAGINKDMWTYAIAVHNIVENDMFKDDFKNFDSFAKAMGSSKGTLSKYHIAVKLITNELAGYGYDMTNMSYTNAYTLSRLGDDLAEFMDKYHEADLGKMTKDMLEDLISKFKNRNVVEEDDEEAEEKSKKAGSKVEAQIIKGTLVFTYRKKEYNVPLEALKDYIIEKGE